jgi:hypothetical protein
MENMMTSAIKGVMPIERSPISDEKPSVDKEPRDEKQVEAGGNYSFVEFVFDLLLFI